MACKRWGVLASCGLLLAPRLVWSLALAWDFPRDFPVTGFVITAQVSGQPKPSTYRVLPSAPGAFVPLAGMAHADTYCADVGFLPPARYTLTAQAETPEGLGPLSEPITCTINAAGTCPDAPTEVGLCYDTGDRPTPIPDVVSPPPIPPDPDPVPLPPIVDEPPPVAVPPPVVDGPPPDDVPPPVVPPPPVVDDDEPPAPPPTPPIVDRPPSPPPPPPDAPTPTPPKPPDSRWQQLLAEIEQLFARYAEQQTRIRAQYEAVLAQVEQSSRRDGGRQGRQARRDQAWQAYRAGTEALDAAYQQMFTGVMRAVLGWLHANQTRETGSQQVSLTQETGR